tara:strand:+ start:1292 stop:1885 length:594 start_codon:yes stop_codon:yes gene_type:complete
MFTLNLKKGAMFGLDARIALAIFGALSVISGAALYSAIQEAKVTSFYTELVELNKAYEAYYLDTGSIDMSSNLGKFDVLIENHYSEDDWNGPYIQAKKDGSVFSTSILNADIRSRPEGNSTACGFGISMATGDYYHFRVDQEPDNDDCNGDITFLKAVHDKFDNDGDYTRGKLKVLPDASDATKGGLFYRIDFARYK